MREKGIKSFYTHHYQFDVDKWINNGGHVRYSIHTKHNSMINVHANGNQCEGIWVKPEEIPHINRSKANSYYHKVYLVNIHGTIPRWQRIFRLKTTLHVAKSSSIHQILISSIITSPPFPIILKFKYPNKLINYSFNKLIMDWIANAIHV